ncbi:MAG: hypothetical protein QM820_24480 [Minicystis sp.]
MDLPRLQLFELNDAPWAPPVLRDIIIEALSRTLDWGGILRGLVAPFEDFIAASGTTEVLDLASGAAGPARILINEILRAGRTPPRFLLTDLNPQLAAWRQARAAFPHILDFVPEPVDATNIPEPLACGRARVIINALHHLPPAVAGGIFADAARSKSPVFIAECFERNPLGYVAMWPAGSLALAVTPLLSSRARLAKAVLTYATPIVLGVSLWDGLVSTMRVYSRADLEAMVAPLGDGYDWTYGTFAFPVGGKGYYFHGVPRR